jgi:release factor glutamine methyltransferase
MPERSARAALAEAAALFGFSATPRLDAELLLAHALGVERDRLLLSLDEVAVPPGFAALVRRRAAHEPIAYITGARGFWTLDIAVGPGALVPRADSETLIEVAAARLAARPPTTILDLGTGPGTLLLALLDHWPAAQGLGVDRSAEALGWARRNAALAGGRARFVQGDWTGAVACRFDLIVSNPPYIASDADLPREVADHEPGGALFAGADGLDDYRRLIPALPPLLAEGGLLLVEIGFDQAERVSALLAREGFECVLHHDLGGNPRVIAATR